MSKQQSVEVFGLEFEYTVGDTETEMLLPNGDTVKFPNWDVKRVTERFYRSEYIDGPPEHSTPADQVRGIAPSDVRKFIEYQRSAFDKLLAPMLDDMPEEEPAWKRAKKAGA